MANNYFETVGTYKVRAGYVGVNIGVTPTKWNMKR